MPYSRQDSLAARQAFWRGLVVVDVLELDFLGDEARAVLASREVCGFWNVGSFYRDMSQEFPEIPLGIETSGTTKNPLPFGNGFRLVEISGIEPLTS